MDEAIDTEPDLFASAGDLRSLDLGSSLAGVDRSDDHALEQALLHSAAQAEQAGDLPAFRGFHLLAHLCSFHLQVDDPAEAWVPRFRAADARGYTASDMRGEQSAILAGFASSIPHPALRARVADVAWYNDRSLRRAAELATDAYRETIEGRLAGALSRGCAELEDSINDLVALLHRPLQILATIGARDDIPRRLGPTFQSLYERGLASGQYVAFVRLARLGLKYGLTSWSVVAADAEQLATNRAGGNYPMAVQGAWNLAAQGYAQLGDEEAKRRCQSASVEETLSMRRQVDSAMAEAYWTRKAIGELRSAGNFGDRIAKLRAELRDLQDASLDERGQFHLPMDLTQERKVTIDLFETLTLPEALLRFAFLTRVRTVAELREQAEEARKTSILGSLMATSHSDPEGKIIAQTPAAGFDGEPGDEWYKLQALQYLDIWRHRMVGGFLEPARRLIMMRFALEERHFAPIAWISPFVPPGHEHLFALGFARLWQGDYASAAHLLIPQLDTSLRFVLLNANRETSKIKPDLLQEDRSLSGLVQSLRPELEDVFGEDLVNEIDLLFNRRAGPSLRHEMAHGKITAGACYHPTLIYACWFIYHLTCLPLFAHWKDHVAPMIERES